MVGAVVVVLRDVERREAVADLIVGVGLGRCLSTAAQILDDVLEFVDGVVIVVLGDVVEQILLREAIAGIVIRVSRAVNGVRALLMQDGQ